MAPAAGGSNPLAHPILSHFLNHEDRKALEDFFDTPKSRHRSWRPSAAKRGSATPAHTIGAAYLIRVGAGRQPARGGEAPALYLSDTGPCILQWTSPLVMLYIPRHLGDTQ